MKCRVSTNIKECCVCMKRLNKNNSVKIKCNHGICRSCITNIDKTNCGSNIIKCPVCRKEYTICDNLKPILFKTVFRDNIELGFAKPRDVLSYTSRTNLSFFTCSGKFHIDDNWIKRTGILYNILQYKMSSVNLSMPLILYVYKDGNLSFTLKSNKPKDDNELVRFHDFDDYLRQDEDTIARFINLYFDQSMIEELMNDD